MEVTAVVAYILICKQNSVSIAQNSRSEPALTPNLIDRCFVASLTIQAHIFSNFAGFFSPHLKLKIYVADWPFNGSAERLAKDLSCHKLLKPFISLNVSVQ